MGWDKEIMLFDLSTVFEFTEGLSKIASRYAGRITPAFKFCCT